MDEEKETFEYWPRFDSYIKTVARRANKRFMAMEETQSKHQAMFEENALICVRGKGGMFDQYPSDTLLILLDGKVFPLTDERLHDAMQKLPEQLLRILILKYVEQYNEKQIATELEVSVRTCYTRRTKALEELRKLLAEEEDYEETE